MSVRGNAHVLYVCSVEHNLLPYLSGCVCECEFLCTVLTLNVNWDTLMHFFCWPLSLFHSFISTFYLPSLLPPRLKPTRATVHSRKRSEPFLLLYSANHPPTPLPPLFCRHYPLLPLRTCIILIASSCLVCLFFYSHFVRRKGTWSNVNCCGHSHCFRKQHM